MDSEQNIKRLEELKLQIDKKIERIWKQYDNPELIIWFTKIFIKLKDNPTRDSLLEFYKQHMELGLLQGTQDNKDSLIRDIEDLYIPTPEQTRVFEEHLSTIRELRDLSSELATLCGVRTAAL